MARDLDCNIDEAREVLEALRALRAPLGRAAELVQSRLNAGHTLYTAGNGGSAADAAHLATEFVGRYDRDRPAYPAHALQEASALTAIGNDYGFASSLSRPFRAFARSGDVLLVLSTSGRSENIRHVLEAARERSCDSIAMLGKDGGSCAGLATIELIVPSPQAARIQEAHKLLCHTLCDLVEPRLGGRSA